MRPQIPHYLSGNAAERSPRRVVVLDTETTWTLTDRGEDHSLRLWTAKLAVRGGDPRHTLRTAWAHGHDGDELITALEAWTRTAMTLWVFAHNLGFDLCTTRIVPRMLATGWTLGAHAMTNDAPWARLSRGRRRMVFCDSWTWLPTSVERIGALVGIPKPALPGQDDGDAVWFERCTADVEVVSTALTQLLDWWDRERLGCFSVTGTATGWNWYRHRPTSTRVVIDPDPLAREYERRAIYAGRRDVWRLGPQPRGRYLQLDLERAHLTTVLHHPLPRKRSRWLLGDQITEDMFDTEGWGLLADCTVRTATPRYPWRHDSRVWHPIGEARTILAMPELVEARRRDELITIHGGALYRLGPTMRDWAAGVAALLDGETPDAPPTARLFAKMCSHRVFGKWAARTSFPLEPYMSGVSGWRVDLGIHSPGDFRMATMHINGIAYPRVQDQEADDAFPAVLAWIQSHTRLALGALLEQLDPARVIACNTDGVLYRAVVDPDLERINARIAPYRVRIKAVHESVDVLGAAHMVLDGRIRCAGVPSGASPTGETSVAWTTWPSLRRQLEMGTEDGYTRPFREVDLGCVPVPRWVLNDGTTRPIMTGVDSLGVTTILPFVPGQTQILTPPLATTQHPTLAALFEAEDSMPMLRVLG